MQSTMQFYEGEYFCLKPPHKVPDDWDGITNCYMRHLKGRRPDAHTNPETMGLLIFCHGNTDIELGSMCAFLYQFIKQVEMEAGGSPKTSRARAEMERGQEMAKKARQGQGAQADEASSKELKQVALFPCMHCN